MSMKTSICMRPIFISNAHVPQAGHILGFYKTRSIGIVNLVLDVVLASYINFSPSSCLLSFEIFWPINRISFSEKAESSGADS